MIVFVVLAILYLGMSQLFANGQRLEAYTLPYVQNFDNVDPKLWFSENGVWQIRNQALAQIANLNKPTHLFIPQKLASDQLYHLSTYLTLSKSGDAAGIHFNAQYPQLTKESHLVYITHTVTVSGQVGAEINPMQLVAGYTDENETFVPQVTVPLTVDSHTYRLDLYVLGNTYTVQLNGQNLIERRPLFYTGGLVGFYTQGAATFDTLKLTTADPSEPGEMIYMSDFDKAPGAAGWVPFGDDWSVSEGELVQANPAVQESGIGYEGSSFENFALRVTFHHLAGVGGGVLFNMPSPYQLNGAQVVRFSDQTDALFWGYYDEQGNFTRQGFVPVQPPGNEPHQVRIFSGESNYKILLDDQLVASDVPLQRTSGHIGLITARSSVAYSEVDLFPLFGNEPLPAVKASPVLSEVVAEAAVTPTLTVTELAPTATQRATPTPRPTLTTTSALSKTATLTVTSSLAATRALSTSRMISGTAVVAGIPTLRPIQQFTATRALSTPITPTPALLIGKNAVLRSDFNKPPLDPKWHPISKGWRIENNGLVQSDTSGFDQSVIYTGNTFRNYAFEAAITHIEGTGAGMLFNIPSAGRINGAHMVRFSERRAGGIFWGYFDENGKFIGQGYATVEDPGTQLHRLRVESWETTYSLYLDDRPLVENLSLQTVRNDGYIGLITSQSSAAYDWVTVGNVEDARVVSATPVSNPVQSSQTFADQRIVNGDWTVTNGTYTQNIPDAADYILNTGIYASDYTAEALITLATKPDSSGGLVFHMPDRGRKSGAFMVRIIRGGAAIFWGSFDESGTFLGRASAELPKSEDSIYHLVIRVAGNRLAISVDDQEIAKDILMPRSEGWIGLLAFGGPITFSDVKITVGLTQ
ncbi:MAG: hypothetical protein U0175_17880 [Caldilineaceae bacterium]